MYTNHGSWVCETCMAKTFVSTHNLWIPLAWRRVDAPNGLLHGTFALKESSCNASTTAVSKPKPLNAIHLVLRWWMWSIHCMIQTSPHCGACRGLIPISSNHFVYHECQSERLAISASHCSEIPLHVWNIWNVSNLAILGRVACNLMRLGSLHSDIIVVQPQLGQRPVDSQRRSQSLDSMDDSKSWLRTTCSRNSYHERVQNANWTLLVCTVCALF